MDATPTIEIFKPGRFTSVDGDTLSFSLAELQDAVNAYDPVNDPAPIVIGHPKLDAPAYGWVGGLTIADDGKVVATPTDVEPAFAEAVRAKRYRKVSACWYPPQHPSNPKPGSLYLKHVGFLGAAAPEVKGLKPVAFSEEQAAGCFTIDLETDHQEKSVKTEEEKAKELAFAEKENELNDRETRLAEREAQAAKAEQDARHAANLAFAEGQVKDGKLLPAGRDLVVGIMDQLDAVQTYSFGEANGELTPNAAFRKLFDGAQKLVSFGEHSKREEESSKDPRDVADRAQAYAEEQRKAGRSITIAAAVRHVDRQAD